MKKLICLSLLIFLNINIYAQDTLTDKVHAYTSISFPRPHEFLKVIGQVKNISIPQSFHVLVWNVFKGQREDMLTDLERLSRNSELILLQEAQTDLRQLEYYNSKTDLYQWDMAQSFFKGEDKISTGVMTGHKSKSHSILPLRSPVREPILGTPKTSILHKFKIADSERILCVVNAHMINFVSPEIFNLHLLQIEKNLQTCHGPIIYAGDFNVWIEEKLILLKKSAKRLGLKPVKFRNEMRTSLFPWSPAFDHIFTRGIRVKRRNVHYQVKSSDHYPLSMNLKIIIKD